MVERTKRRTDELNTAMGDVDSDAMEPDIEATSDSEEEDALEDMMPLENGDVNQQPQQRSSIARTRKDSTTSASRKKLTSLKARSQRTSERRTSLSECVECDSASVDSLKPNEYLSPEQVLDVIDEALNDDKHALDRLTREPIANFPVLNESTSSQLLELLLRNPQLPVFGHVRWLKRLLANGPPSSADAALLKKSENKRLIEPLIERSASVSEHCLRLRGKLDLLLSHSGSVS